MKFKSEAPSQVVKLAEGLGFNTDSADLQNFFKNIINSSDKELQRKLPALERRGRKLREKQRQRKPSPYANARPEAESGSSADSSPEATPRPPHNSDSSLSPPGPSGVILDTPEVLRPAPSESESPSDPENSEASDTEQYVSSEDILAESDPPAEPSDQPPEDSLLESPVLPEPPDPAMPAGGENPTQAEKADQLQVESEISDAIKTMGKENPRLDRVEKNLDNAEKLIRALQGVTFSRLAAIKDDDKRSTATEAWSDWKSDRLDALEDARDKFEQLSGKTAASEVSAAVALAKARIHSLESDIEDRIRVMLGEINKESNDLVLPPGVLAEYSARCRSIQQLIRPDLAELYEQLAAADPTQKESTAAGCRKRTAELQKELNAAMKNLYRKKFADSSFTGGAPLGNSTPNNSFSIIGGDGSASSSGGTRYNYPKATMPKFDGDPIRYPQWRKEMQNNLLKGADDAYALRMMSELSPQSDLPFLYTTQAEAWVHMNNRYANPTLVSKQVIKKFMEKRSVEGPTEQAQLVNLHKVVQKCYLTLQIVGQEKQLTEQHNMITKAVDLLPPKYAEDFTDRVIAEEAKLPDPASGLEPLATYNLLAAFLKAQATKLEIHHPELLTKKREKNEQEQRRRGKGDGNNSHTAEAGLRIGALDVEKKTPALAAKRGTSRHGQTVEDAPAQFQDAIKKSYGDIGPCPCCSAVGHVYEGKKGSWGASSSLADCPKFINDMTVDQRGDILMKKGWCFKCVSWKHAGKDCKKEAGKWFCHIKTNGKVCNKPHSNWLHGCKVRLSFLQISQASAGQLMLPVNGEEHTLRELLNRDVMLPIVEFHITESLSTLILLDGGATNSLITNKLARKLRLKPYVMEQAVTLATKEPEIMKLNFYGVVFELEEGPRLCVLLGVDRITTSPGRFSVEAAYEVFPHIPYGALDRKSGQVEILIGQDNADLLPGGGLGRDLVGSLRVFSIPFGPGMVLTGHHPQISFVNPVRDDKSLAMHSAKFQSVPSVSINMFDVPGFYETEMLGYSLPPLCNNCQSCAVCTVKPGTSVRDTQELQLMRQNIWHNAEDNTITVSYPVKPNGKVKPEHFRDNERQAITRAESTMRSLKSRNLLTQYNGCVKDYIDRGVWKKVSREEINAWKEKGNPVHFVAHHGIEKPDSLSTQLRIVVDSSLKNNWTGPRLSELWCKGPNYINDLYDILISWRELMECGVFDVRKAYHSLKTTDKENFMRLVVWKEETALEWDVFLHTVVGMGDVPASLFLELSKEIASDHCRVEDPLLAEQIKKLSYVDDAIFGGTKTDVERMRGDYVEQPDGSMGYNGTIHRALARVGMREKVICVSGETDPRILAKQGKVLGLQWNPTPDTISFKLSLNFTEKRGAARVGPDLTDKDLDKIAAMTFTKRLCLQAAAQNFDPLGLIASYTVRFKLLLKEIVAKEYGWDDVLADNLQKEWKDLLTEVLCLPELVFPRSISHGLAVSRPEIIAFADGSTVAFGSIVYIRFRLDEDAEAPFHTAIMTSKSRVTPKHGMTPPRSELQGLIIAVRLVDRIMKALTNKPMRATVITDSQCSVAALDVNASSLATFFANRALEIANTMASWGQQVPEALEELADEDVSALQLNSDTRVDLVQHTPGVENPADWPTRGNLEWSKMGLNSEYQLGPPYLRLQRPEWHVSRSFVSNIPVEERRKKFMEPLSGADINLLLLEGEMRKPEFFQPVPELAHNHRNAVVLMSYVLDSVQSDSGSRVILSQVLWVMGRTNSWIKARNVVARLIRLWKKKDRKVAYQNPSREEFRQAEWLCQLASMPDLFADLKKKNNLESLCITFEAAVAKTRGRLSKEDMNRAMGFDSLTVLPYKSRLAYLLTVYAHSDDHRAGGDTLLRVRRLGYWIISGRKLATKVAKDCRLCKLRAARTEEQQMASLPRAIMEVPCRAFSHICVDFTGGVKVRGVVNSRASKTCYPLVFTCINTGALHLQLAQGYSTEDFLLQFDHFCAIRGVPVLVRTDMGSQLVAAGRPAVVTKKNPAKVARDQEGDLPTFPWDEIKNSASARAVEFQHCATQAQWRNGRAERAVAALKKTLFHLTKQPLGRDFNYAEVSCLLSKAADIINRRPIGARHHGKAIGEVCVITPAMLLQGGRVCSGDLHDQDLCHTMAPHARMSLVEETFQHWWRMWFDQVWESLIPVKKWRTEHRNLVIGDVVLLKYSNKFSKPSYRYGRVIKTLEDDNKLVRDVVVATRTRRHKEKPDQYVPAPMDHQLVPVQRVVLLLPAEDRDSLQDEPRDLHICEESLNVPGAGQRDLPPPSPSPTAPPAQCAQTPEDSTEDPEAEDLNDTSTPTDPEVVQLNQFIREVVTKTEVDALESYYCMSCSLREALSDF